MDHNVLGPEGRFESDRSSSLKQKGKPISAQTLLPELEKNNENGSLDCNICLDSAQDPVVTLCGHLFCWPCIYKWLKVQMSTNEPKEENCPVCKANISYSSLVPLYGRGSSPTESETKKHQFGLIIPRRPTPSLLNTPLSTASTWNSNQESNPNYLNSLPFHNHHYSPHGYIPSIPSYIGSATITSLLDPTIGIFGEMIFNRTSGSANSGLFQFPYSNSYQGSGNSRPRMRRQEMQLDKSLNRVSIFLFCSFILCLLLF